MTDMIQLITKLVNAAEPSRELDALIWAEINGRDVREDKNMLLAKSRRGPRDECLLGVIDPGQHSRNFNIAGLHKPPIPKYTTSIDDALKLLRPHYLWQVKQGIGCTAIVWWLEKDWDDTTAPAGRSTVYPALALTTAALIARAVEDRVPLSQIQGQTMDEAAAENFGLTIDDLDEDNALPPAERSEP